NPIIANADFYCLSEIARLNLQDWTEPRVAARLLTFDRRTALQRDQCFERIINLLGADCDLADVSVVFPFKRDVEVLVLSVGTVVSEIQGFLDQIVQIDLTALASHSP